MIFFLLLATHFFLKSIASTSSANNLVPEQSRGATISSGNDKYFLWTGVVFGLGLLTKYNVFILIPIFITFLLIYRRDVFKNLKFWLGALIALVIFSPVIIYNIALYRSVGHFDFQFSYIFGQHPEVWKAAPGKEEIGGLSDRFRNFFPVLFQSNSYGFLPSFLLAVIAFIAAFIRRPSAVFKKYSLIFFSIFFLTSLIIGFIGPSIRFLTMLTPFMAITNGIFANAIYKKFFLNRKHIVYVLLGIFLLAATLYSINSQILNYPIGQSPWFYSEVRRENYNWGYNALGIDLEKELRGKMPAFIFTPQYKFLEDVQAAGVEEARRAGKQRYPAVIIYDGNILNIPQLWFLDRLQIYHGWPVLKTSEYADTLRKQGLDYFRKIDAIQYFIAPTAHVPLRKRGFTGDAAAFERELLAHNIFPGVIQNARGEDVFRIYKF